MSQIEFWYINPDWVLTHFPLKQDFQSYNCQTLCNGCYISNFCAIALSSMSPSLIDVNIGFSNWLVPSGIKPLPEPISTQNYMSPYGVTSLWWLHMTSENVVNIMSVPSYYLSQCSLIVTEVLWYSPENNLTGSIQDINLCNKLENDT